MFGKTTRLIQNSVDTANEADSQYATSVRNKPVWSHLHLEAVRLNTRDYK